MWNKQQDALFVTLFGLLWFDWVTKVGFVLFCFHVESLINV